MTAEVICVAGWLRPTPVTHETDGLQILGNPGCLNEVCGRLKSVFVPVVHIDHLFVCGLSSPSPPLSMSKESSWSVQ